MESEVRGREKEKKAEGTEGGKLITFSVLPTCQQPVRDVVYLLSIMPHNRKGGTVIPIFQREKLRPRESSSPAQGHSAKLEPKLRSSNHNPGLFPLLPLLETWARALWGGRVATAALQIITWLSGGGSGRAQGLPRWYRDTARVSSSLN